MNKKLIIAGGIFNLLIAIMHLALYPLLNWSHSLECLSHENRAIMQMLNNHVALTAFIFFYISIFHYKELLTTRLGRVMLLGISAFYFLRGIEEFIYYDIKEIFSGFYFLGFITFFSFGIIYLIPFIKSSTGNRE